jgi:hypothetical protein
MNRTRRFTTIGFALALALTGCSANTAPSTDTLARGCVLANACNASNAIGGTVGQCAAFWQVAINTGQFAAFGIPTREAVRIANCGSASNCSAYANCLALDHNAAYCGAHPGQSCDGNVLVQCPMNGAPNAFDCGAYGLSCRATGAMTATCTNGNACDPMTSPPRCDGSRIVSCGDDHLEVALDCGQFGPSWTCGNGMTGVRCVPPTSSCTADATRCDGDTLVTCPRELLHEIRTDCTQEFSGGHCSLINSRATCVPGNSGCDVTSADTCSGAVIQTCINGNMSQIDCTSLGFARCEVTTSGGSGMRATCVN